MIGINGGGKTTSIGKIAYKLKNEGKTVMLLLPIPSELQRQNSFVYGETG